MSTTKKEAPGFFTIGNLKGWKPWAHLFGCLFGYWITLKCIHWFGWEEFLQIPKTVAGFAVLFVIYMVEYIQVRISKGKIDVVDIVTGIVGIITGYALFD